MRKERIKTLSLLLFSPYGSDKQLEWAKDIKRSFDMRRGDREESLPDIPYAKFWIDNRNKTYDQMMECSKK